MDDEVISEEFLAELHRSSPFAKPRDAFMRQWLEEHCNEETSL